MEEYSLEVSAAFPRLISHVCSASARRFPLTQIPTVNTCGFGVSANKMSTLGCGASIFVALVIFGSGCEPRLPPVHSPWPDVCQLGCDKLARSAGNEALGTHLSLLERWRGGE